jgi:outer membrane protein assembly factor BamA
VWVPVLGSGAPSKFRDFVRRNVRLAAFYDVGRIGGLAAGVPSATDDVRHGTGVGFRVRYQGVIIETDWGYGFGSDETQRPGRGRLYFNFRLP